MIKNIQNLSGPSILDAFRKSPYDFYLTGSRMWHDRAITNKSPHESMLEGMCRSSDWDFFVKDSEEAREWLVNNGLIMISEGDYTTDGQCVAVFQKTDDVTYETIQVQMVTDDITKNLGQEVLLKMYPQGFFGKLYASMTWKLVLDLYTSYQLVKKGHPERKKLSNPAMDIMNALKAINDYPNIESLLEKEEEKERMWLPLDNMLNGHTPYPAELKDQLDTLHTALHGNLISPKGGHSNVYYELKNAGYQVWTTESDSFGPLCCAMKSPFGGWYVSYG